MTESKLAEPIEPTYSARVIETYSREGYSNTYKIGVFFGTEQIGAYDRNYGFMQTFFPFKQGNNWYALYSPKYTVTRLMSLPSCKDIGGEESCGFGFCPVEFLVPEITSRLPNPHDPCPDTNWQEEVQKWAVAEVTGEVTNYYWPDNPKGHTHLKEAYALYKKEMMQAYMEWAARNPFTTQFATWGLVAGCVWGDDNSWKVQYLDLTRASEGILLRDQRFGYIELPPNVSLKDAVYTENVGDTNGPLEKQIISIAQPVRYNLAGKRQEEESE